MNHIFGYVLCCPSCSLIFVMCKSCYRNHKYCSLDCRKHGYAKVKKRASHKYDQTIEAKLDHRDRSRRHRLKNTVTDQTSNSINVPLDSPSHEQIEQTLFDLEGPAVCVSCKKTVFDKGATIYGRSL